MICPYCGKNDSEVTRTDNKGNQVKRHRRCKACHLSFSTSESLLESRTRHKCPSCNCGRYVISQTHQGGQRLIHDCVCANCGHEFKVSQKLHLEAATDAATDEPSVQTNGSSRSDNPYL